MGAYRHITVQLPYGMYMALKNRSIKRETSYSEIVRKLLDEYLNPKTRGTVNEQAGNS